MRYDRQIKLDDDGSSGQEKQRVFQKPGKPLYFGRKDDKFVFALPGNPASSLSCFYIYVLPLLYKLIGSKKHGLETFYFPVSQEYEKRSDSPSFLKAKITNRKAEILDGLGSFQSMALGNALVFLEAETQLKKGNIVKCFLIS